MTRIEKAVREVSDMRDFYLRIPKLKNETGRCGARKQPHRPAEENKEKGRRTGG
jgi:hypothetical protein